MKAPDRLERDPEGFMPQTEAEFALALGNPLWRLSHLYKILVKEDDEAEDAQPLVLTFRPNAAQKELMESFWYRNIILKARQLGFTTFIAIYFLDCCLFRKNVRAGMIAQTEPIARKLFRDKIKFAYDNLPDALRESMPLSRQSAEELMFGHNDSSIQVSTSMRGGTLNYLHVSEFGKICAEFPKRANEVVTGSIPTVPQSGIIFIESTAEGREGHFYRMSTRAEAMAQSGKRLARKDYKFHFFPWWRAQEYRTDPDLVVVSPQDHAYFDELEGRIGQEIDPEQRAWYVVTRDGDLSGDDEMMNREYPSTPAEAFSVSTRGTYYAAQLAHARKERRILPHLPTIQASPCWTFWDIGNSDGTAIWVIQKVGQEFRVIRFYEAWGEPYSHAAAWLQSLGLVWDTMYLPHDADHVRQGQSANKSPRQMLSELMPGVRFEIIPRIEDVNWGIQQTRDVFPMLWFDESECKEGIVHLELYRRRWNEQQATWGSQPDKTGGHSEAADALRQFAQAYHGKLLNISRQPARKRTKPRNWRVA